MSSAVMTRRPCSRRIVAINRSIRFMAKFLLRTAQGFGKLAAELDGFSQRPACFAAARLTVEKGNPAQALVGADDFGICGDGQVAASTHRFEKGPFGRHALLG